MRFCGTAVQAVRCSSRPGSFKLWRYINYLLACLLTYFLEGVGSDSNYWQCFGPIVENLHELWRVWALRNASDGRITQCFFCFCLFILLNSKNWVRWPPCLVRSWKWSRVLQGWSSFPSSLSTFMQWLQIRFTSIRRPFDCFSHVTKSQWRSTSVSADPLAKQPPTNLFTYLDLTTAAHIHTDRSINSRLTIDYDQSTISHGKWTFEFNNNVLMPTGFVMVGQ